MHYFQSKVKMMEMCLGAYPKKASIPPEQLQETLGQAVNNHLTSGSAYKIQTVHPGTMLVNITVDTVLFICELVFCWKYIL